MIRNVLLMLSSDQPPHPEKEVAWHAAECAQRGETALLTTRRLTKLVPDRSEIAFYGDAKLGNRYLGRATFLEYVPLTSTRGATLLANSSLYRDRGMPRGARAFLILREVEAAAAGQGLEVLSGTIRSSGGTDGRPLALEHLPDGAARIQVYYTVDRSTITVPRCNRAEDSRHRLSLPTSTSR